MAGNNVSQRSYNSRIIAICFVSELAKRRAWRERRHRLLAFHVFTLHQLLAASAPAQEQDPDGPEPRALRLRQAQATQKTFEDQLRIADDKTLENNQAVESLQAMV